MNYRKATREDCARIGISFPDAKSHYRIFAEKMKRGWFGGIKGTGEYVWVTPEELN